MNHYNELKRKTFTDTEKQTITEINTIDGDKKLGGLDAWL